MLSVLRCATLSLSCVLLLGGCKETLEKQATEAGCGNLERRIGDLFARAGRMEQIERQWTIDIQQYGMKREPFAASQIGGDRARAARYAVRSMISSVGHQGPQQEDANALGVQLYNDLSSFEGKYSLRDQTEDFFENCSSFVGQYLVTGSNWNKVHGYFQNPPR